MPNRWTGAHDVAIQLAPLGANSLLAAIHRKGHAQPEDSGPHLFHSLAVNLPLPQSAATHGLRGHLQVQISTPAVSVAEGATGRVIVAAEIYAWFRASFGSASAPEFVHGELRFTTPVSIVECADSTLAEVRVGGNAVEVSFFSAQGAPLSEAHHQLVETAVRDVLAEALGPIQFRIASLGSGATQVGHVAFRTLRTSTQAAFFLLLSFGPRTGPAPDPTSAGDIFLASSDGLALALGRDFISAKLRDAARAHLTGIAVSGSKYGVSFNAAPNPDTLRIELRPGALRAIIDGTGSLSPGGSFAFRLRQDFGLTTSGGDLLLTLVGEPALDITQGNTLLHIVFALFRGAIVNKIEVAASGVVQVASAQLDALVDASVRDIVAQIGTPGVGLRLTRAVIDADAVILGAAFDLGGSPPPFASFTSGIESSPSVSLFGQTKFSAFESWIPGGTISRYAWLQVRSDGTIESQIQEPHRFVLRPEPVLTDFSFSGTIAWPPSVWCLQVHGTQFRGPLPPGLAVGTVCGLRVSVPAIDLSLLDGRLTLEVDDGEGGPSVDVDPWSRYRAHAFARDDENRGFLFVHRSDPRLEALPALDEVLRELGGKLPILPTIVMKERDRSARSPRELARYALTRDPEGAWCKRFALERDGASVLVGAGGKVLWRDAGPLRADALRKAIKGLDLTGLRLPRQGTVQLGLLPGAVAHPFFFSCQPLVATDALIMSLKRLVGQEVDLVFWTTWSRASLEELRRRNGCDHERKPAPRTILVNDGEDPELVARFMKQHGLAFEHVATDPDRKLSRKYGISCWPTVVRVDARGRIATARFGLEHAHAKEPRQES